MPTFSELTKGFAKSPMPAMIAALLLALTWTAYQYKALNEKITAIQDAGKAEVLETERRCALEKAALYREMIDSVTKALEEQKKLDERVKRLKRK